MASESVRKLAREKPDAFERVANAQEGNQVCEHLKEVLEEERAAVNQHQRVPADD